MPADSTAVTGRRFGAHGASLGMSILGPRVVRLDIGEPAGVDHQFVRWVLWFVDGFAAGVLHRRPGTTPDGSQ